MSSWCRSARPAFCARARRSRSSVGAPWSNAASEPSSRAAFPPTILDLRTVSPWDRDATLASVRKTRRCLIVHEDTMTAGFGAEIAAILAKDAFFDLDAPIERLAMPDVPSPHSPVLLDEVLPSVATISRALQALGRNLAWRSLPTCWCRPMRKAPAPPFCAGASRWATRSSRMNRWWSSRPTKSPWRFPRQPTAP